MQATKSFPATYEQIRPINQFIASASEEAGFDAATRFKIELACDEALNNIIEHAYGGEGKGDITVGCSVENGAFRITLHDTGRQFTPAQITEPNTTPTMVAPQEIPVGGLGMHMMQQVMDEIAYDFGDDGNTVTMVKWLPRKGVVWYRRLLSGVDLVSVVGRLDADTNPELEAQLMVLVSAENPRIIIDLSQTPYVNSGGLRVLVSAWRTTHQKKGDVILCGLNAELQNIFSMVGFDKIFRIEKDVAAAQTYFAKSIGE